MIALLLIRVVVEWVFLLLLVFIWLPFLSARFLFLRPAQIEHPQVLIEFLELFLLRLFAFPLFLVLLFFESQLDLQCYFFTLFLEFLLHLLLVFALAILNQVVL